MPSSHVLHQTCMDFPKQPRRQRQRLEPLDACIEGGDIVDHFVDVPHRPLARETGFGGDQIVHRRLSAFNLTRQHSLAPNVHGGEQFRMRQRGDCPVQAPQSHIRLAERGRHRP
ncbi:hypothetical protein D3C85_1308840 [compost metagenome]